MTQRISPIMYETGTLIICFVAITLSLVVVAIEIREEKRVEKELEEIRGQATATQKEFKEIQERAKKFSLSDLK